MSDLGGLMKIKGRNPRSGARYLLTYLTSDDQNVRAQAIEQLKQLRSLDEMDAINTVLVRYKEQTGTLSVRSSSACVKISLDLVVSDD